MYATLTQCCYCQLWDSYTPVNRENEAQLRHCEHGRVGDQCLFVASTTGQEEVIRVILSIYVRRGRLPAPGELLFCTAGTTDEELELLVRRFADERKRSWLRNRMTTTGKVVAGEDGDLVAPSGCEHSAHIADNDKSNSSGIYVLADVHRLSYSSQALLRENIRSMVLENNTTYNIDDGHRGDDQIM